MLRVGRGKRMAKRMRMRMRMRTGTIWANRPKRKKMLMSLVESGETVEEASSLDVPAYRKRIVVIKGTLSLVPK